MPTVNEIRIAFVCSCSNTNLHNVHFGICGAITIRLGIAIVVTRFACKEVLMIL